jgi:IBR domain.
MDGVIKLEDYSYDLYQLANEQRKRKMTAPKKPKKFKKRSTKNYPSIQEKSDNKSHIKFDMLPQRLQSPDSPKKEKQPPMMDCKVFKEEIDPIVLQNTFGELYIEGKAHPRKFLIMTDKDPSTAKILIQVKDTRQEEAELKVTFLGFKNLCHDLLQEFDQVRLVHFTTLMEMFLQTDQPEHISSFRKDVEHKESSVTTISRQDIIKTSNFYGELADKDMLTSTYDILLPDQCQNCFGESTQFTTQLLCLHTFCSECWESYFKMRIVNGVDSKGITCLQYQCDTPIGVPTILAHLPWGHFQMLASSYTNHLIRTSKNMEPCPVDYCESVVKVDDKIIFSKETDPFHVLTDTMTVKCSSCQGTWCFECRGNVHWPLSCQIQTKFNSLKERFVRQGNLDSKGRLYRSKVYGKLCPKCGNFIEKNGGCSNMTCRCNRGVFCWECMETLNTSTSHYCNKIQPIVFVGYVSPAEKRLMAIFQENSKIYNLRRLALKIKKRKPSLKGSKVIKDAIVTLKESYMIVRRLRVAQIVSSKKLTYLRKYRDIFEFLNHMLQTILENSYHTGKMDPKELAIRKGDVEQVIKELHDKMPM